MHKLIDHHLQHKINFYLNLELILLNHIGLNLYLETRQLGYVQ